MIDLIRDLLKCHRLRFGNEADLQTDVEAVLKRSG